MQGTAVSYRLSNLFITLLALMSMLAGLTLVNMHQSVQAHSSTLSPNIVRVHPHYIYVGQAKAGTSFSCQNPSAAVHCYGPTQIRNAYDVQPILNAGITGKGRTIVIIGAYQSPTIQQDLSLFDSIFGLPDPKLNIIQPEGVPPFDITDPVQTDWASEITLDVEWAHAIAPDATINLVEARSPSDQHIFNVTKYAIDNELGDVISQSFGEAETCANSTILRQEHQLFFKAALKGISVFASSGDQGAAQPTCNGTSYFPSASSPASDPFVTAVGGTSLKADLTSGQYQSETTWNEPQLQGASGGGFSTTYPRPLYQIGTPSIDKYRGEPDVSYNAAVDGGVLVVFSSSGLGTNLAFIFGGTSAGSPQWAGITALGAQKASHSLGLLNSAFYVIGHSSLYQYVFHDTTSGNNSFTTQDRNGNEVTVNGYSAHSGWDASTGWGSPDVAHLLSLLPSASAATQIQISQIAH